MPRLPCSTISVPTARAITLPSTTLSRATSSRGSPIRDMPTGRCGHADRAGPYMATPWCTAGHACPYFSTLPGRLLTSTCAGSMTPATTWYQNGIWTTLGARMLPRTPLPPALLPMPCLSCRNMSEALRVNTTASRPSACWNVSARTNTRAATEMWHSSCTAQDTILPAPR